MTNTYFGVGTRWWYKLLVQALDIQDGVIIKHDNYIPTYVFLLKRIFFALEFSECTSIKVVKNKCENKASL